MRLGCDGMRSGWDGMGWDLYEDAAVGSGMAATRDGRGWSCASGTWGRRLCTRVRRRRGVGPVLEYGVDAEVNLYSGDAGWDGRPSQRK